MKPRICLVSDALWPPFDEGMKVFALQLARYLCGQFEFSGLTNQGGDIPACKIRKIEFSKALISRPLRRHLCAFSPDIIIYLPQASATTNSFIRAWLLKRFFPSARIIMLGLQPRQHPPLARWLIARGGPDALFVQGKASRDYFTRLGLAPHLLPSGVDVGKFRPADPGLKARLREQYGVRQDVFLVTHVGHLRASRNLDLLKAVSRRPRTHMLMVASSFSEPDRELQKSLAAAGVDVRTDFTERLEEIYQMSDAYLFPVLSAQGAIEMPLSVLEALACGLPVVSTPFGALEDELAGTGALHLVRGPDDLEHALDRLSASADSGAARRTALRYSWESVFERYLLPILLPQAGS